LPYDASVTFSPVESRAGQFALSGLLLLVLALDSILLESLSQDLDLAKVRVAADALDALLSARAPLFVRGLALQLDAAPR
jgi:hypothetical protein